MLVEKELPSLDVVNGVQATFAKKIVKRTTVFPNSEQKDSGINREAVMSYSRQRFVR